MTKYLSKNLGHVYEEGYELELCEAWIRNEDVRKLWTGNTRKLKVEIKRHRPKDIENYCWFGLLGDFPYEEEDY